MLKGQLPLRPWPPVLSRAGEVPTLDVTGGKLFMRFGSDDARPPSWLGPPCETCPATEPSVHRASLIAYESQHGLCTAAHKLLSMLECSIIPPALKARNSCERHLMGVSVNLTQLRSCKKVAQSYTQVHCQSDPRGCGQDGHTGCSASRTCRPVSETLRPSSARERPSVETEPVPCCRLRWSEAGWEESCCLDLLDASSGSSRLSACPPQMLKFGCMCVCLVYLKYWTLNLRSLMVYPKVLFHPSCSIKDALHHGI